MEEIKNCGQDESEYLNMIDKKFDIHNVDLLINYLVTKENVKALLDLIQNISDNAYNRGYDSCESKYKNQMTIRMTKDEYTRNCKALEDGAKNELMEALIYFADHKYNINIITESGRGVNSLEECCRYLSADQIIEQAEIMKNNFNNLEKMLHIGAEVIYNAKSGIKQRYVVIETEGEVGKSNFSMRCLSAEAPFKVANLSATEATATGRDFSDLIDALKTISSGKKTIVNIVNPKDEVVFDLTKTDNISNKED